MITVGELVRNVIVLEAPAYEPVSRVRAKAWCRIDDDITDQDAVVDLLITAARERAPARSRCQRAFEAGWDCACQG